MSFSVVPMIDYNRSTTKRALDDDVELAIILDCSLLGTPALGH